MREAAVGHAVDGGVTLGGIGVADGATIHLIMQADDAEVADVAPCPKV